MAVKEPGKRGRDYRYLAGKERRRVNPIILRQCVEEGMKATAIAYTLEIRPQTVRDVLVWNGLYALWRHHRQRVMLLNKKEKKKKQSIKLQRLLPILEKAQARDLRVHFGEKFTDCRIEGLPVTMNFLKTKRIKNKKHPEILYYIPTVSDGKALNIGVFPNGKLIFRLPKYPYDKDWAINAKLEDQDEVWPTRNQFRIAKAGLRSVTDAVRIIGKKEKRNQRKLEKIEMPHLGDSYKESLSEEEFLPPLDFGEESEHDE